MDIKIGETIRIGKYDGKVVACNSLRVAVELGNGRVIELPHPDVSTSPPKKKADKEADRLAASRPPVDTPVHLEPAKVEAEPVVSPVANTPVRPPVVNTPASPAKPVAATQKEEG